MSSKGTILSLVLSVNLIVFLFLPQKAYSQACGQVVIDSYTCNPNPDPVTGVCAPPYRTGSTLYLPCSIQGNSCQSSFGYCSSRDSCVNVGGTCNCTAQRVDCNTSGGTPGPPEPPQCDPFYKQNCGIGETRGSVINTQCISKDALWKCDYGLGTAQTLGPDCGCYQVPGDPGDPPDTVCDGRVLYTHECISSNPTPTPLSCTTTSPSDLTFSDITATGVMARWLNGLAQEVRIRVSENLNDVMNGCPSGSACVHASTNQGYIQPASPFASQQLYYYRKSLNQCVTTTSFYTTFSACETNLQTVPALIGDTNNICYHSMSACQTHAVTNLSLNNLLSGRTYYWRVANTDPNGQSACVKDLTRSFTTPAVNPTSWWQVKDGDVTSNGNISSTIPDGAVFSDVGTGNYPGVPIYSGSLSMASTPLKISNPQRWNSNTQSSTSRTFNYQYFSELVPSDVVFKNINQLESSGNSYHGYEWYKVTGNHTISSSINFGNRKVLIFIENGNLTIDGNLTLDDGLGFLAVFVGGNINIGSSLPSLSGPELEGLYLANGTFTTGESNTQLHIRGSVVALQGFNLQRNLDNNIAAAEIFEYAADQVLLFPEKLAFRQTRWLEVNP